MAPQHSVDGRLAVKMLGGSLGAVLLANCSSSTDTSTSTTGGTDTTVVGTTHTVTPEGKIGPYFTDDSAAAYNRSNILSNIDGSNVQTGIPLTLKVMVYDTRAATHDVWRAD